MRSSTLSLPLLATALQLAAAANASPGSHRTLVQAATGSSPLTDTVTLPTTEFAAYDTANPAMCGNTMKGCTGSLSTISHDVAGEITVVDDCTFRVTGWQYDGLGPAVEWWAAPADAASPAQFDYNAGVYIATLEDDAGEDVVGACMWQASNISLHQPALHAQRRLQACCRR